MGLFSIIQKRFNTSQSRPPKRREREGRPLEHWSKYNNENNDGDDQALSSADDQDFFRDHLTRAEYRVLRKSGTEFPRSSTYDKFYPRQGHFACRACGLPLYAAKKKFDSGTGWPSFGDSIAGQVTTRLDIHPLTGRRQELRCRRCASHLGHVFEERNPDHFNRVGPMHEQRHCINGVALSYVVEDKETAGAGASS